MGLDKDGGIWKQYFFEGHTVVKVQEGWAQAAAMLSFLTAWRLSEDDKFLQQAMHSYHFVHKRIIDAESGSWLPAVDTEYKSLEVKDQEILTKYPMHNFRALNETIQLIDLYLE